MNNNDGDFPQATLLGLTGKAYVWIAAQSAVGSGIGGDAPDEFPAGMLGVHFATDPATMQSNIGTAMSVLGQALDSLAADETMTEAEKRETLRPEVSCRDSGEVKWERGQVLYRRLRNVSVDMKVRRGAAVVAKIQSDTIFTGRPTANRVQRGRVNQEGRAEDCEPPNTHHFLVLRRRKTAGTGLQIIRCDKFDSSLAIAPTPFISA